MKTLKSVTLENRITIELVDFETYYQVVSHAIGYPEKIAHLDKAEVVFDRSVALYSRFKNAKI